MNKNRVQDVGLLKRDDHSELDKLTKNSLVEMLDIIKCGKAKRIYYNNITTLEVNFNLGKILFELIEKHKGKPDYKNYTISSLSEQITLAIGKGYSRRNLQAMLIFYTSYKKWAAVPPTLSWEHIRELIVISNDDERKFYETECIKNRWSTRDLRRQIKTSYYNRKILGYIENTNDNFDVGNELISSPNIVVNPLVLDFFKAKLDLKEKDIETEIISHMKEFLLELGSGFRFIDNQYQFNLDNKKYFVDLVFYNEILKCYVLIELKSTPFHKDVIGQINTYLNYFKNNKNKPGDTDPIGIVMCTDFEHIQVEYALGNISNQIFVTKYITHLPKKEDLERELLLAQKR